MDSKILLAAEKLLQEPQQLEEIPIQRAVSALGISALTLGSNHSFHHVVYLIYPNNLYLSFDGHAAKDMNGNYDSPIFQNSGYNYLKPLWQEFRERAEAKLGTSITQIFFGDYLKKDNEEFFTVKDEPKDCHWCYTKKRNKDSVFITRISREQAQQYQAILDELRLERAIGIIRDRLDREDSRACRQEAIITLNSKYPEEFERFTFGDETFRFRQFQTEFLYTATGLNAFDDFYRNICIPYREDEIADAEWEEKSRKLETQLLDNDGFGSEFRLNSIHNFKITRLEGNSCRVESDLIDDRTGRQLSLIIASQKFDDILNAVISELTVVFQRKKQARRATATLQSLASKK